MGKSKNIVLDNGVLTSSMDTKSREFREFQHFISEKAGSLSESEKSQIELFAIQVKIEDYLNSDEKESQILTVGDFLRLYINKLGLKQNTLAEYIGMNPGNFSKILSGNRKVNVELSYMLSQIFNLEPKIWMLIQVKNEYLELKKNKAKYYQNFKLEDLINA